jgi:hypothetical protein
MSPRSCVQGQARPGQQEAFAFTNCLRAQSAAALVSARYAAHGLEFGSIEAEVLSDERTRRLSVLQLSELGLPIADDVDALVHDVDAAIFRYGTSQNITLAFCKNAAICSQRRPSADAYWLTCGLILR